MKKGLLILVLVVILIVIVQMSYMIGSHIRMNNNLPNENRGSSVSPSVNNTVTEKSTIKKLANAEVKCVNEEASEIPTENVEFEITLDKSVNDNYVNDIFYIENAKNGMNVEYNTEKVSSQVYKLTLVDRLSEGEVYNVVEKTSEGIKRWAFQTKKKLDIEYTYPSDGGKLYTNSRIEIRLNFTPVEDFLDYVTIEPEIAGKWEKYKYSNNSYYFEHSPLKAEQKYTVTIKKGMHDAYDNEMKHDYSFSFITNADEDYDNQVTHVDLVAIQSENAIKPGEKFSMDVATLVCFNGKDRRFDISDNEYRIYEINDKKEFISILKGINTEVEYAKKFWNESDDNLILKDKIYESKVIVKDSDNYRDEKLEKTVSTDFSRNEEGYYVALVKVNETYDIKPFQINKTIANTNILSTREAFFVVKDAKNAKVYINEELVGTVDNDGVLYVENYEEKCKNISKEFNYIEIKSDNEKSLIFDATFDLFQNRNEYYYDADGNRIDTSENVIVTRFNNGYLYHDRPVYKVGEDIHFWGYARNRVYDVKDARLKIFVDSNLVAEEKLKLNKLGCFEYTYNLSDVNPDSYIMAELYVNKKFMSSRYIKIEDYSTRKYVVDIQRDGNEFIAGDSSTISVSANTYDGIPLSDTEFKINESNASSRNVISTSTSNITTDMEGNGTSKVEFKLTGIPTRVYSESHVLRVENSLLDGGEEYLSYYVYPYKNSADLKIDYDKEKGEYKLSVKEYDVLKTDKPANDKIIISATARYDERVVDKVVYDEYTKENRTIYKTITKYSNENNKKTELIPENGKTEWTVKNWSDGKNEKGYYTFSAYIVSDLGYDLMFSNDYGSAYLVYGYDMWATKKGDGKEPIANPIEPSISGDEVDNTIDIRTKANKIPMYHSVLSNEEDFDYGKELVVDLYAESEKDGWYNPQEGKKLDDYSNIEMYTLLISGKGAEIIKTKNEQLKINYDVSHGANISLLNVIYDGTKVYTSTFNKYYHFYPYSEISLDKALKEKQSTNYSLSIDKTKLDFDVEFDKKVYEPGDIATINIKTLQNGKGAISGVNISGVDTGYLDENDGVYVYIADSVMNPYSFLYNSNNSHAYNYIDYEIGEGGEGGGDGDADRDNILTTAMFENIITDKNGNATIKVQLPDNITEWTLTCQAISEDYFTGNLVKTMVVTKDFYVDVSAKDKFIENEKFSFNVKAMGKDYFGKTAKGIVQILDNDNKVLEEDSIDLTIGRVSAYKVKNGLTEGKYKIRLEGTYNDKKDAIVIPFEVKESLFETSYREQLNKNKGDSIEVLGSQGELYAVNSDVNKVIRELYNLVNLKYEKNRNDCKIISDVASEILAKLIAGKKITISQKDYLLTEVIKSANNSSDDVELALRNIATGKVSYSPSLFERVVTQKGEEAGLWARAAIGETVLKQLRNKKDAIINDGTGEYTKEQVLYVALGLAEIGDYENALDLYEIVKPSISKENDTYEYDLLGILTIKLNLDNREDMYKFFVDKYKELPEYSNYYKLYYIMNELSRNFEEGKLTLSINGKNKEIEVKNVGLTRVFVNNKSSYKIVDKSDNVDLWLSDYKEVDVSQFEQKGYIKKTYSKQNPKLGDTVTVTLTIDKMKFHENVGDGVYTLMDIVPNNMSFMEVLDKQTQGSIYYDKKDGQKVLFDFFIYYNPKYDSTNDIVIKYDVKVANDGDQVETGVIVQNSKEEVVDWIKN